MARNVEIKARVDDIDALRQAVQRLATSGPEDIVQDDTFFPCESGRLKLRVFSSEAGELIFYRRANDRGPKESFYLRAPTADPVALRDLLETAYGRSGQVRKRRALYLIGRTRIHLDVVEGLGDFLELEVVLEKEDATEDGVLEANGLLAELGIERSQLVEGAYVDLLSANRVDS